MAALIGSLLSACAEPVPELESVLLVTVDTMRPDYMSMEGYPRPTTPVLDELLSQGTYFERAITPIPRTVPAVASLFTGAYPHTTGVRTQTSSLQPGVRTLAEVLVARGYQTRAIFTNHMIDPSRGFVRGFEDYRLLAPKRRPATGTFEAPSAAMVTEVALSELGKVDPEAPLFMWVHYLDPHIPYEPPARLAQAFDPGYDGPHREEFNLLAGPDPDDERGNRIHRGSFPEHVNEHIRRLYAATYRDLDDNLAPLLERARELFGDKLLIVFTADHGESLGEHDFYWDHGDYVYSATTRVPLGFVFPPSHPLHGGRRRSDRSSLVDVTPTILELLGIPVAPELAQQIEGQSLAPAIRGGAPVERAVFAESGHCYHPDLVGRRVRNDVPGRFRTVLLGDWKLVWTPFQTPDLEWELYDTAADPHETTDLYGPDRPEVPELRARLEAWMRDSFLEDAPNLEGKDLETLKALGYVR